MVCKIDELSINKIGNRWVIFRNRKVIARAKTFKHILRKLK